jgi:hypothetical protein
MKRVFLSLLVMGLLALPCIANALNVNDADLLLYFNCNEGAGTTVADSSPHGNDGEIVDTVGWVDGKDANYGTALDFSEAGEVRAPYIPLNDKSFSICLWIKPKLSGGDQQCVISQMEANAQNTSLHYRIYNNGTVRMGFYSNDLDAAEAVTADEWAHICYLVDVDAGFRRIYVNGVQAAEDAGKAGLVYLGTSGDTIIGSWGTSGQKFNGAIDEVQIWDRALSEAEITESMESIAPETPGTAVDVFGKLTTTWGSLKSD